MPFTASLAISRQNLEHECTPVFGLRGFSNTRDHLWNSYLDGIDVKFWLVGLKFGDGGVGVASGRKPCSNPACTTLLLL